VLRENSTGRRGIGIGAMLAAYLRASKAYPARVQMTTGAIVMAVGDGSVQIGIEHAQQLDTNRTSVAGAYNGMVGAVLFRWYNLLDGWFPGSAPRNLVRKVVLNQMVSSPIISPLYVVWSTCVEAVLNGHFSDPESRSEVGSALFARLRHDVPTIVGTSFCVWIPANTINFVFIPPHLRIAFMSAFACAWGGFLSYMTHREADFDGCDAQ
jgi:hypothetical protein